jgi:hypothetical protein
MVFFIRGTSVFRPNRKKSVTLCQQELNITIYSDRLQPPNLPLITSMVQAGPFTAVQYSKTVQP